MVKCPVCGSEYNSSADRCYACSAKLRSPVMERRVENRIRMKKRLVVLAGLLIFFAGFAGAVLTPRTPAENDLTERSFLFIFIGSIGSSIAAFGLFGTRTPLWMVHSGHEPNNRKAGALMSLGVLMTVMAVGSAALMTVFGGLDGGTAGNCVVVILVSALLMDVSLLRRPAFLFREDERVSVPRRERVLTGIALSSIGLLAFVLVVVLVQELSYLVLLSIVLIVVGVVTILEDSIRPWVSTGYEK